MIVGLFEAIQGLHAPLLNHGGGSGLSTALFGGTSFMFFDLIARSVSHPVCAKALPSD